MPVRPAIVAHRGASARHPENTLRALRAALEDPPPADGVEFDIRRSADGVPVLFHDDDTERLTGKPGSIEARSLAEIRALDVSGEAIPTLAESLAALAPLVRTLTRPLVNVELKPTGSAAPLVAACRSHLDPLAADPALELVVSSFDARVLHAVIEAGAPWRLALIYDDPGALRFLEHLPVGAVHDLHPDHRLLDGDEVARLRTEYLATGGALRVWTVDDPDRARWLGALGVDAIITNRPQALKETR